MIILIWCKFLNLSFNEVMAMPIHEFNQIIKKIKRKKRWVMEHMV
jgi:hypothetical protein